MHIPSFDKLKALPAYWTGSSKPLRYGALLAISALGALIIVWVADRLWLLSVSRSYVDGIASVFNLNRHLAEAISLVVCVILVAFISLLFSFSRPKRLAGTFGLVSLLVANSLALWQGTKGHFFEANGNASKCYVMTRQGVRFGERVGTDQQTGKPCRPVTPEMMDRLSAYAQGKRPERVASTDPDFFDLKTGEPNIWYAKDKDGEIELFDLMGYQPDTGEELQPITKQIVQDWRSQQKQIAEREPTRIEDPKRFVFFDPKTGNPRAWYWLGPENAYEFYDNKGFQPTTGDALKVVTRGVLTVYSQQTAAKCYVVTRETIRFGNVAGPDPQTGRECRAFTPALMERLKDYARGSRPKPVIATDTTFFDLRTGEPNVWYSRDSKGSIKLFDLIGFDPDTGQELLPVNPQIVNDWKKQIEVKSQKPPQLIEPDKHPFFDTVSGDPQVWYWHGPGGEWEFYDNRGYRKTGEELTLISPNVIELWQRETTVRQRQAAEQAAQAERQKSASQEAARLAQTADATREAAKRQAEAAKAEMKSQKPPQLIEPEKYPFFNTVSGDPQVWYWHGSGGEWEFYDNRGYRKTGEELALISPNVIEQWRRETAARQRQAAEQAAEAERQKIASQDTLRRTQIAEAARETEQKKAEAAKAEEEREAGGTCDRLAANPTDARRPSDVAGINYADLKADPRVAIDACSQAVRINPTELRYKYNLARALEFTAPQKAINIYAELIKKQYAAAYDNYGGAIWREHKDLTGAIQQYEQGAKLGDPGAMVSLAWLIQHNKYPVSNPDATRHALLMKAAQAGHKGAQETLDSEQQQVQARAYQQQNEQQQQQMMMNLLGGVVRGMAR